MSSKYPKSIAKGYMDENFKEWMKKKDPRERVR